MKTKLMDAEVIIVLVLFISLGSSVFAVEGGLGRPISGMSIAPYAGVIPPEPASRLLLVKRTMRAPSVAAEPCQ